MRPEASSDPTVELVEEFSDVGAFVVLAPTSQNRIQLGNQLASVLLPVTRGMVDFNVVTGSAGLRHYATSKRGPWNFSNQCKSALGYS